MSSDRPRPTSLRRGPAPAPHVPDPDEIMVVFHFDHGGATDAMFPASEAGRVRESVGHAWNNPNGQMFTIDTGDGRGLLINLSKVRAVEIR